MKQLAGQMKELGATERHAALAKEMVAPEAGDSSLDQPTKPRSVVWVVIIAVACLVMATWTIKPVTWEYEVGRLDLDLLVGHSRQYGEGARESLATRGSDGWEIVPLHCSPGYCTVLKKRKSWW